MFADLVRRHAAVLYRVALTLCRSDTAAQDAAQDAYFDAWRRIKTLRDPSQGRAWLLTILRRRIQRSRRWRRLRSLGTSARVDEDLVADPAPDTFARIDDREALERVLVSVPEPHREALVLVFLAGLTPSEVADHLGVPKNTVLTRLYRGRAALRAALTRPSKGGKP